MLKQIIVCDACRKADDPFLMRLPGCVGQWTMVLGHRVSDGPGTIHACSKSCAMQLDDKDRAPRAAQQETEK